MVINTFFITSPSKPLLKLNFFYSAIFNFSIYHVEVVVLYLVKQRNYYHNFNFIHFCILRKLVSKIIGRTLCRWEIVICPS